MMAFSRTSNFLAHPYAAKVVRTVRTILHDIDPIMLTTERLYMCETWPYDDGVHMIPVTYNRDWVACERQRLIECGQLEEAFRLHFVLGLWNPTDEQKGEVTVVEDVLQENETVNVGSARSCLWRTGA